MFTGNSRAVELKFSRREPIVHKEAVYTAIVMLEICHHVRIQKNRL